MDEIAESVDSEVLKLFRNLCIRLATDFYGIVVRKP